MKTILCSYKHCGRYHARYDLLEDGEYFEDSDFAQTRFSWQVPDDFLNDKRVYCSIECACLAGDFSVTDGFKDENVIIL